MYSETAEPEGSTVTVVMSYQVPTTPESLRSVSSKLILGVNVLSVVVELLYQVTRIVWPEMKSLAALPEIPW